MLVGRDAEIARVRDLTAAAAARRSGVLVITGDPGIGKTALLKAAAVEAGDDFRVLRATGMESESELPFAGLHELVRPVLGAVERLVPRQAEALLSALALGGRGVTDRFAASAAVLSLLAESCEAAPILAIVDDAQWLDGASADAIAFAARRLDAERVALLVAQRSDAYTVFTAGGFPELRLGPLDSAAARALGAVKAAGEAALERLVDAAAGNPLALVELVAAPAGEAELPATVARVVERLFGLRLARLSPAGETAALVAALSEDESLDPIMAAAGTLGVALADWEDAEESGVLRIGPGRVHFRHPLLRATVQVRAAPRAQRAAHGALADALAARGEVDRAAWHRAAAAIAPEEAVAAALEAAAGDYARRGGHLAAARALAQAARQSPGPEERARRLLLAAEAAMRAAPSGWAGELAAEALSATRAPAVRARGELLEANVEAWRGSSGAAYHRYLHVAETADDAELAATALGNAAALAVVAGDTTAALQAARQAVENGLDRLSESAAMAVRESLGSVLALRGETAAARAELDAVASWYEARRDRLGAEYVAQALLWIGEHARAGALLDGVIAQARRSGGIAVLSQALAIRADLGYRTGEWTAAAADAAESVRLAEDARQGVQLAYSLATLAILEAGLGSPEARDRASLALSLAQRHGLRVIREYAGFALGALELAAGRPDAALDRLEPVAEYVAGTGRAEPAVLFWPADLVEAAIESGRHERADALLGELEAQTARTGGAWAQGAALRCRGLLAGDDELEAAFEPALRLHAEFPFELARTQLCYGERLRRAGRRVDARARLRAALDGFERLGAAGWGERAARELAASGERLRPGRPSPVADELTRQEMQIARTIAAGATNKEAAADLFLSAKTIETHLTRIYRKLGIRSRTELARAIQE